MTGIGAQIVVRELRKLYDSVEVSHEDEAVDITTTAWWKEMEAKSHPGMVLWTHRDNAGLTLEKLAKLSKIARSHLSGMENGKRSIGVTSARKLSKAFGVDYRLFL
jgi:antitoxin component HigA of HigAB toxin-antitoxin module